MNIVGRGRRETQSASGVLIFQYFWERIKMPSDSKMSTKGKAWRWSPFLCGGLEVNECSGPWAARDSEWVSRQKRNKEDSTAADAIGWEDLQKNTRESANIKGLGEILELLLTDEHRVQLCKPSFGTLYFGAFQVFNLPSVNTRGRLWIQRPSIEIEKDLDPRTTKRSPTPH